MDGVLAELANHYQQLYLRPGDEAQYREIVRKGKEAEKKDLSHFKTHPADCVSWEDTPAGRVRIVYLYEREDFELFLRIMAKQCRPVTIPPTQGAAIIDGVIDWEKIHAHRRNYIAQSLASGALPDWPEEFRLFTADKKNYTDALILLSSGPYSGISAEQTGISEQEWIEKSLIIRKYHECTHFICRRLYPQKIDAIWDELIADAAGLLAAFGAYLPDLAERFLGIQNGTYIGGRLENYITFGGEAQVRALYCHEIIRRIYELYAHTASNAHASLTPYQFALTLEERKEEWTAASLK